MARASSPPEATLASGSGGSPGLAASRKVTSSPGSSPDLDLDRGLGHRQLAQVAPRRPSASAGAAARRAAPTPRSASADRASACGPAGVELGGRAVAALELAQARAGLARGRR